MRRLPRQADGGFTLIELVITIVIMGIITLPLGNFALAYFKNVADTQSRLSDSHDIQIAAAYFSQDVANIGVRPSMTSTSFQQSVWVGTAPAPCAAALGNAALLLKWGDPLDYTVIHSAAYVVESGTLHRVYCASGTSAPIDVTVVHNLQAVNTPQCTATGGASTACDGATPPATISLPLVISSGPGDRAAPSGPVNLTGQRRQS